MQQNSLTDLPALLDPSRLFFFCTNLGEDELDVLKAMIAQPGDMQSRADNVHFLLCLMHDGLRLDQRRYMTSVFLPWSGIKQRTRTNRLAIAEEMSDFHSEAWQVDARKIVGLYRSIVAELFDPYITLATATLQFLENRFKGIDDANVAVSERTKAEFLAARDGFSHLLSGYDPLVRNAASHPGSHGVTYREASVVFKDISRNSNFKVKPVEWSFLELRCRIEALYECIVSVEIAENVFGIDCTQIIVDDVPTLLQHMYEHFSPLQRANVRSKLLDQAHRAAGQDVNHQEFLATSMDLLIFNYQARDMPFTAALQFRPGVLTLIVPIGKHCVIDSEEELVSRVLKLLRYSIVAVGGVGEVFETIEVLERSDDIPQKERIRVLTGAKLLSEYAEERAGLVDILSDSQIFIDRQQLHIAIDFDAVSKADDQFLGEPFPRKERQGNNA